MTTIQLCTSHITKNMKDDVNRAFKNKNHALFIAAAIGGIFDFTEFDVVDDYIKKLITVLMSRFENAECTRAKNEFSSFSTNEKWNIDETISENTEHIYEESSTIYKYSKYFQMYSDFTGSFKEKTSSKNRNPMYNPPFVAVLLKKYFAYLPLWTSLLTSLRSSKLTHANNGIIEGKN